MYRVGEDKELCFSFPFRVVFLAAVVSERFIDEGLDKPDRGRRRRRRRLLLLLLLQILQILSLGVRHIRLGPGGCRRVEVLLEFLVKD